MRIWLNTIMFVVGIILHSVSVSIYLSDCVCLASTAVSIVAHLPLTHGFILMFLSRPYISDSYMLWPEYPLNSFTWWS